MSWLSQLSGEDENDYIEVNRKYLDKLEKELEVYKKALKMMSEDLSSTYDCDQGMNEICKICMSDKVRMKKETCSDFTMRYFIQKAREAQNDGTAKPI